MFSQPCYYCNRPPSNVRTRTSGVKVTYQGLDRIDNEKGYIKDNVVPCCKHCNAFKLDRTQEELYQHVEEIYKKRFNDQSRRRRRGKCPEMGNILPSKVEDEDIVWSYMKI